MTDIETVRNRWGDAVCENVYHSGYYTVWDIPQSMVHGVRFKGDVALPRCLLGLGVTEQDAWRDAAMYSKRIKP